MEYSQLKQTQFGPYEIKQDKIGSGNAVTVFKALNLDWNTDCCVKIVDKSDQSQMKQYQIEKQISSELKWVFHKNLVRIYDIIEKDNYIYIFQELCDQDLGRYKKQLDREQILDLIIQVASGYIQLMERNIMHRDIKQDNILIKKDKNGQIIYKLADFGQSKKCDEESNRITTRNQQGTQSKKAPEINESDYSYLADIFSFGLVLLELYLNIQIDKIQHKNCLLNYLKIKSFIQIKEMNDENKQQFEKIKNIFEYNKDDEIIKIIDQLLKYNKEERICWQNLLKKAQDIKKIMNDTQGNIQKKITLQDQQPHQLQQNQLQPYQSQQHQNQPHQLQQNQLQPYQSQQHQNQPHQLQQNQLQPYQSQQHPKVSNFQTRQTPKNQQQYLCQIKGNGIQNQPQSNLPVQYHQPQSNLPLQNQPQSNLPVQYLPQSNLPQQIHQPQNHQLQNNQQVGNNFCQTKGQITSFQNKHIKIQQNQQIIPLQNQQPKILYKSSTQQQFCNQGTINRQPSNNMAFIYSPQNQQIQKIIYRAQ
ncbi:unnamed protein product [Paramecium pentaurelia]|uniref:Protein kinase domain-containing protein n=1 Tax=Paramecium pentaurelia TaxID=43138 RepID=A0A8S1XJ91_9CILI|nr:unnamed protein product [Paramecium pentaurelia]